MEARLWELSCASRWRSDLAAPGRYGRLILLVLYWNAEKFFSRCSWGQKHLLVAAEAAVIDAQKVRIFRKWLNLSPMNDISVHPFTNRAGLRRKPGATQETEGTKDRGDRTTFKLFTTWPLCALFLAVKLWSNKALPSEHNLWPITSEMWKSFALCCSYHLETCSPWSH